MITTTIFDLDGTLVQTERLKAISYAQATVALCPRSVAETEVIEAFKDVVGLSRREVALALVERFHLEEAARAHMAEFGVQTPWQAFIQIRLGYYDRLLADPDVLRGNQWPHNVQLLHLVRRQGCRTALATMSHCEQVRRVLAILDLQHAFEVIATRDDVECGKPDPEIYALVAAELGVESSQCLVLEDSPAGVQAALSAGMACIAISTPFTQARLHAGGLLDRRWIVDNPDALVDVVASMFAEHDHD